MSRLTGTARPYVVDHGGAGTRVMLLHGLGGSHAGWGQLAPRLAERMRVRALDLPGFGLGPDAVRADMRSSAAAVSDLLRDIGPAVLMGCSMGAVVSLLVSLEHPALVDGMIWLNPGLPRSKRVPMEREVAAIFRPALVHGPTAVRERWDRLGPSGAVDETLRLCTADASSVSPEIRAAMVTTRAHTYARPGSARAYAEAVRSLGWVLGRRRHFRRMVRRVRTPVLVIHGTEDRLVPIDSARELLRDRPDWTLVELPGVGHLPQIEAPDAVTRTVVQWTTDLEPSSGTRPAGRPTDA